MTYKGYTILLERQQCEVWTLDYQGDAKELVGLCSCGVVAGQRYAIESDTGAQLGGTLLTFEHAKAAVDMYLAQKRYD